MTSQYLDTLFYENNLYFPLLPMYGNSIINPFQEFGIRNNGNTACRKGFFFDLKIIDNFLFVEKLYILKPEESIDDNFIDHNILKSFFKKYKYSITKNLFCIFPENFILDFSGKILVSSFDDICQSIDLCLDCKFLLKNKKEIKDIFHIDINSMFPHKKYLLFEFLKGEIIYLNDFSNYLQYLNKKYFNSHMISKYSITNKPLFILDILKDIKKELVETDSYLLNLVPTW